MTDAATSGEGRAWGACTETLASFPPGSLPVASNAPALPWRCSPGDTRACAFGSAALGEFLFYLSMAKGEEVTVPAAVVLKAIKN